MTIKTLKTFKTRSRIPLVSMALVALLASSMPGGNAWPADNVAACVTDSLNGQAILLPPPPPYPTSFSLPHNPATYTALFNEAKRLSLEGTGHTAGVDIARIEKDAARMAAKDAGVLTPEEVLYLKEARKLASGLRSAYKLFSATHDFPPNSRNS